MSLLIVVDDDDVASLSASSSSSTLSHKVSRSAHHLKSSTYLFSKLTRIPAATGPANDSIFYIGPAFSARMIVGRTTFCLMVLFVTNVGAKMSMNTGRFTTCSVTAF